MARLPPVLRAALLGMAACGMLASLFWDEFLAHVSLAKRHLGMLDGGSDGGDGGEGKCPMMSVGAPETGATVDLAKMLQLDSVQVDEEVDALRARALEVLSTEELEFYDGAGDERRSVLVAVDGFVFDVTEARSQYAPAGSYNALAGKAITRALTLSSLDPADMSDDLHDLTPEQNATRTQWFHYFVAKYAAVARLGDPAAAGPGAGPCASESLAEAEVEEAAHLAAAADGRVFDVGPAAWLYGTQGVRYFKAPPPASQHLYTCVGRVAASGN